MSHFVECDEHWKVGVLEFGESPREIITPIEGLVLVHQPCFFSIPLSLEEVRNATLSLRRKDERLEELDKVLFNLISKHP